MKPKTRGADVQFFVVQPTFKTEMKPLIGPDNKPIKDEFGKRIKVESKKFIKENYLKVWMSKEDVGPYGEYVGTKGVPLKNRTMIYNGRTNSYYTVAHSLQEVEEAVQYESTKGYIGYKTN